MRDSLAITMNESMPIDRSNWIDFESSNDPSPDFDSMGATNVLNVLSSSDRVTPVDTKSGHPLAASDSNSGHSPSSARPPSISLSIQDHASDSAPPTSSAAATITPSQSNTIKQTTISTNPSPAKSSPIMMATNRDHTIEDTPGQSIGSSLTTKNVVKPNTSRPTSSISVAHPLYRKHRHKHVLKNLNQSQIQSNQN